MFLHDCMLQRELLLGGGEESTIRRRNLQYVSLSKVQMSVMKPFISVPSFLKCVPLIQHVGHLLNFVLLFQNKGWNDICCRKHHREPPPDSSTDGSGMFACLCLLLVLICAFLSLSICLRVFLASSVYLSHLTIIQRSTYFFPLLCFVACIGGGKKCKHSHDFWQVICNLFVIIISFPLRGTRLNFTYSVL